MFMFSLLVMGQSFSGSGEISVTVQQSKRSYLYDYSISSIKL